MNAGAVILVVVIVYIFGKALLFGGDVTNADRKLSGLAIFILFSGTAVVIAGAILEKLGSRR